MSPDIPISYTKGQVNAAGAIIRDHTPDAVFDSSFDDALNVLGVWRTSHAHPLQTVYMALRERAKRIDNASIASQRLKRVPSIIVKLQRNHTMKLTTVQDIGGCRAVLSNVSNVKKLARKYPTVVRDYITNPKPDGYRSIHLVEQYEPTLEKHLVHAGRRIEVQLRTGLQHAWATAVETVDSLLGQNLKTGGGHERWKRFFALSSSVIAMKEDCPIVPHTPDDKQRLKQEIKDIAEELNVFTRLDGLTSSVENLAGARAKKGVSNYVLVLNLKDRKITPFGFAEWAVDASAQFYLEQEKKHYGDPLMQIVQVSVSQVRDLKRAFPNYYLNAQAFLNAVKGVL